MRRRIFATLLSLCLVLGLLPTAAFAQDTSNYVTQEDSITGLADGEQAFPERWRRAVSLAVRSSSRSSRTPCPNPRWSSCG